MKKISVFILSIFVLSSCHIGQKSPEIFLSNSKFENQLMLFSDDRNVYKEGNYYDALLEIKKTYPIEVSNLKVVPYGENEIILNTVVSTYPALIIIKDNKVIEHIEGELSIEQIVSKIENALSNSS